MIEIKKEQPVAIQDKYKQKLEINNKSGELHFVTRLLQMKWRLLQLKTQLLAYYTLIH